MKQNLQGWPRRLLGACCAVAVCLAALPGRVLATVPTGTSAGVVPATPAETGIEVLWYEGSTVILLPQADGATECIASRPTDLAFAMGYLAGRQAPGDLSLLRLALADADAPADAAAQTEAAAPTAALISHDAAAAAALADWPAAGLEVLQAMAAGLNRAGATPAWTPLDLALLATEGPVLARLTGASPPVLAVSLAGPAAAAAWGEATRSWAVAVLGGRVPGEQKSAAFAWVQLRTTASGSLEYRAGQDPWRPAAWQGLWFTAAGPLLWTDEQLSLGLVYHPDSAPERLADLRNALVRALGATVEEGD